MNQKLTTSIVKRVYSKGATRYDETMLQYWEFDRKGIIETLDLHSGERVLEVGVGTGRNLPYYPDDVCVIGIDITPEMLALARDKRKELGLDKMELIEMDAARMTLSDDIFDAALESFVLCVVPKAEQVLTEILRVTKPGAKIAIFDYCRSQNPETRKWQELIAETAQTVGFPPGVIVWDPLRDYEDIITEAKLPLKVESIKRHENSNPFLMACSMLLINQK